MAGMGKVTGRLRGADVQGPHSITAQHEQRGDRPHVEGGPAVDDEPDGAGGEVEHGHEAAVVLHDDAVVGDQRLAEEGARPGPVGRRRERGVPQDLARGGVEPADPPRARLVDHHGRRPRRQRGGEGPLLLQGTLPTHATRVEVDAADDMLGRQVHHGDAVDDHEAEEPAGADLLQLRTGVAVAEGDRPGSAGAVEEVVDRHPAGRVGPHDALGRGPERSKPVVPVAASTRASCPPPRTNTASSPSSATAVMLARPGRGPGPARLAGRRVDGDDALAVRRPPGRGTAVRGPRGPGRCGSRRARRCGPSAPARCARRGRGPHPPGRRRSAARPCSAAGRRARPRPAPSSAPAPSARPVPRCRPPC